MLFHHGTASNEDIQRLKSELLDRAPKAAVPIDGTTLLVTNETMQRSLPRLKVADLKPPNSSRKTGEVPEERGDEQLHQRSAEP